MKTDRSNKNFEFISAKRKYLEDEFRRAFQREDFNIDRLVSHAEQVKYAQDKVEMKDRLINDLQDKISTLRDECDRMERQHTNLIKQHEAVKFKSDKLQRRLMELEDEETVSRKLELENIQLKMELKKFQDSLKEMVDKYEGEWQRNKQAEISNQAKLNEQLTDTVKKLQQQADRAKERMQSVQREHLAELKTRDQSENALRREIAVLNERNDSNLAALQKLRKTLEEEQSSYTQQANEKRALFQECCDLKSRLESVERFTEKIEAELKKQLQIKDQDLQSLKNDHQKALTQISSLLVELERTRRMERHLSDQIRLSGVRIQEEKDYLPQVPRGKSRERHLRMESPDYHPIPAWDVGDIRSASPQYGLNPGGYYPQPTTHKHSPRQSAMRVGMDQGKKFYDIVKRSKAAQLPQTEARVVNRILQKARYIT